MNLFNKSGTYQSTEMPVKQLDDEVVDYKYLTLKSELEVFNANDEITEEEAKLDDDNTLCPTLPIYENMPKRPLKHKVT